MADAAVADRPDGATDALRRAMTGDDRPSEGRAAAAPPAASGGDDPLKVEEKIGAGASRAAKETDALEKIRSQINPPALSLPAKPSTKGGEEAAQLWGALAIAFGALASTRVRSHMTAALNSAGAALTSMKQRNAEEADRAFKTWEMESKQALEVANYQREAYAQAMGQIDRREEIALRRGEAEDRATEAKVNALGHMLQDPQMVQALQRGGLAAASELQEQRKKQEDKLKEMQADVRGSYLTRRAIQVMEQTPEWKEAVAAGDASKQLQMLMDVGHNFSPQAMRAASAVQAPPQIVDKMADAIGTYRQSPFSGRAAATGFGAQVMSRVLEKYPNYDAKEFSANTAALKNITNGKDADTVRSFAALRSHLDYLSELIKSIPTDANTRLTNETIATIARQFGDPTITSFETAAHIVSDEEVKAILGQGAGALADREAAVGAFKEGATKGQLMANIETIKHLVGGQLGAIDLKYRNTGLAPDQVIPQFLRSYYPQGLIGGPEGGGTPAAAGDHGIDAASLTAEQKAGTAKIGDMGNKSVFLRDGKLVFEDGTPVPRQ